jgi:hypothetical protein
MRGPLFLPAMPRGVGHIFCGGSVSKICVMVVFFVTITMKNVQPYRAFTKKCPRYKPMQANLRPIYSVA